MNYNGMNRESFAALEPRRVESISDDTCHRVQHFLTGNFSTWQFFLWRRHHIDLKSQKALSAYLQSKQILPFGFARYYIDLHEYIHVPPWNNKQLSILFIPYQNKK